jgi:hypothetical protein
MSSLLCLWVNGGRKAGFDASKPLAIRYGHNLQKLIFCARGALSS